MIESQQVSGTHWIPFTPKLTTKAFIKVQESPTQQIASNFGCNFKKKNCPNPTPKLGPKTDLNQTNKTGQDNGYHTMIIRSQINKIV